MIGIIAAMEEELQALLKLSQHIEELSVNDLKAYRFKYNNQNIVATLSGIGKANAAYTTSVLIHSFNPKMIINIGSAGGLKLNQEVGDIVIADIIKSHDLDIGIHNLNDPRFVFYPTAHYFDIIERTAKSMSLKVHRGEMVSGDQFVTHGSESLKRIQERFDEAMCVEMESFGIATACSRSKIDFIIIRSLSDVPLRKDNELEFEEYLELASNNAALLTKTFIESIS